LFGERGVGGGLYEYRKLSRVSSSRDM
jgi:hypothetical protein